MKISDFLSKNFKILVVIFFSIYLNRRVFVMCSGRGSRMLYCLFIYFFILFFFFILFYFIYLFFFVCLYLFACSSTW